MISFLQFMKSIPDKPLYCAVGTDEFLRAKAVSRFVATVPDGRVCEIKDFTRGSHSTMVVSPTHKFPRVLAGSKVELVDCESTTPSGVVRLGYPGASKALVKSVVDCVGESYFLLFSTAAMLRAVGASSAASVEQLVAPPRDFIKDLLSCDKEAASESLTSDIVDPFPTLYRSLSTLGKLNQAAGLQKGSWRTIVGVSSTEKQALSPYTAKYSASEHDRRMMLLMRFERFASLNMRLALAPVVAGW